MPLFQYAAYLRPTKKETEDDGAEPVIVMEAKTIYAKDQQTAAMKAAREIPEQYADKLDRLEVAVRPF